MNSRVAYGFRTGGCIKHCKTREATITRIELTMACNSSLTVAGTDHTRLGVPRRRVSRTGPLAPSRCVLLDEILLLKKSSQILLLP